MSPAEPNADELLGRFLAGDESAFARLYDAHARRCFAFVLRLLAGDDSAAAEDIHQETWLAVARSARSFDSGKARFVTWLFTIARNKVMDHFRRRSVVVLMAAETADEASFDDAAGLSDLTPERIAEDRQLAAAIIREVEALPLAQRETFVLFAHHELSLEEVAQISGVGVETAKSRLRYARRTLGRKLSGWNLG